MSKKHDTARINYSGVGLPDYIPSAISTRYDQELEWDTHGKLAWASSSAGGNVYFTYDANGQRLTKTASGVLHEYFYEGTRLLYETFGNNKLIYLYDESGSIEAFLYNGTKYYLVKNLQGDVVQLRNQYNQIVARYTYNAFGYLLSVTDASGNEITNATNIALINPIRYRGYYYDNETRWYYLNSRYYNPELGRFVSADVLITTDISGLNLFAYCYNDPANYVDPYGYCPHGFTPPCAGPGICEYFVLPQWSLSLLDEFMFSEKSEHDLNRRPYRGEPNSTYHAPNGDSRTYGSDGTPEHDYDHDDHGHPEKHPHDENGGHNHDWENGERGPAYSIKWEPIAGGLLASACTLGIALLVLDDASVIGVADDFLFGPLSAGIGQGIIMITG